MTRYMLSVHTCEGEEAPSMSEEEMRQSSQHVSALES
jgi:hypothetical protein